MGALSLLGMIGSAIGLKVLDEKQYRDREKKYQAYCARYGNGTHALKEIDYAIDYVHREFPRRSKVLAPKTWEVLNEEGTLKEIEERERPQVLRNVATRMNNEGYTFYDENTPRANEIYKEEIDKSIEYSREFIDKAWDIYEAHHKYKLEWELEPVKKEALEEARKYVICCGYKPCLSREIVWKFVLESRDPETIAHIRKGCKSYNDNYAGIPDPDRYSF